MSIRVIVLERCNRMFLLWCLSLFTTCRGFLLNSTGGAHVQHMQDSHYLLLMDLLSVERQTQQELKQSLDQMENFVLKLQNQINSNSGEIVILKSQLSLCETKCDSRIQNQTSDLKETVKQMNDSQGTMSRKVNYLDRKVNDLEGKLMTITNENVVIKQENIMILNKVTELNNRTLEVKESVQAFSHSDIDLNCQNLTKVEESIKVVNKQIEYLNSQYVYLSTSDNSRKQDVLALINENNDAHQRIDVLATNISQFEKQLQQIGMQIMMARLAANSNKRSVSEVYSDFKALALNQSSIAERLSNISSQMVIGQQQSKVILTARGNDAPTYNVGATIKFPVVMTNVSVTHLDDFGRTGKFNCTESGIYLFSVSVMSPTSGAACEIKKSGKHVLHMYVNGISGGSTDYHTASQTITLYLEPKDTVYVSAFNKMVVHADYSSFTIIKL